MQYVSGECRPAAGTGATVAHDLRQYLAAGLLLTEDDRTDAAGSPRSRLRTLHGILLSMRDLVAVELDDPGGGDGPAAGAVDLGELAADCLRVVETTHRCTVRLTCPDRAVVSVDPVALRRAVMNVADNAGRAAGPRGTVAVTVEVADDCAVVTVADDGLGFGRIEPQSGRGLGIVDRALDRCGGWLEVASAPGTGTQVRLTVPLRREVRVG